jgi:hypothetical protein
MADDTRTTRPGDLPGVLKTGEDGSVPDTGGRRAWVWIQDTDEGGGGRFDVLATRIDMWLRKGATVVPNYPLHFGPSGRLAKPRHQFAQQQGGEASAPSTAGGVEEPPPPDPTLTLPASALGAVEPADERQPDSTPPAGDDSGDQAGDVEDARLDTAPTDGGDVEDVRLDTAPADTDADAGDEQTDQAAGEPAAAKTTTRRGGRTR